MRTNEIVASVFFALAATSVTGAAAPSHGPAPPDAALQASVVVGEARYIVQATTPTVARQDVERVGGKIEQSLAIIKAVSANLNPRQVASLRKTAGVRVFEDRTLVTEGSLLG